MKTTHQFQAEYGRPVKPVVIAQYILNNNQINIKLKDKLPNNLLIQTINIQDDNLVLGINDMYLVLTMLPDEILNDFKNLKYSVTDFNGNTENLIF